MKPAWILIADGSRARIFTAENSAAQLVEIDTLTHPESRLHESDLNSDVSGQSMGHTYTDETSSKEHEEQSFARHVAHYLCKQLNSNKFDNLFVIAAPSFLGDLRGACSQRLQKHIAFSLNKNVVTMNPQQIRRYLPMSLMA